MIFRCTQYAIASAVLALVLARDEQLDPSTHPTKMSVQLRETLCSQQRAMCTASCQDNILENTCDVETLTWSCFCTKDTTKVIENWQFPIPFKLCRNQLSICLQDCTIDEDQNEINVLDEIQPWQQQPLQQQRYQRESGEGPGGYHDFDQDDWDAIEELQLLRDHSKLETDSYSRFKEEDVKSLKLFKKKKQLHKKVWDRQRNEISKIMAEESEGDGDFTVRKNIVEFATYTDPKALRDPSCVNECQAQFSCGTGSAPQFHGPKMVKNINV